MTGCITQITPESLLIEWEQIKGSYNEVLAQVKKTLKEEKNPTD